MTDFGVLRLHSLVSVSQAQARVAALANQLDWNSVFVRFVPLALLLEVLVAL
jgi:hypothetical protein